MAQDVKRYSTYIYPIISEKFENGQYYYRVRLGPYEKEGAQAVLNFLNEKEITGYIAHE